MPRRARLALPGVPLHLIQRGNNRQACFFADEDYRFYLVSAHSPKDFDYITSSIKNGYAHDVGTAKVSYEYRQLARGTQASVEVVPV